MGKYKHGKPNQETEPEELKEALEKAYFASPLHKSYLACLYWIGARRTEPLEVKKEDVSLEGDRLAIIIPAKKHGQRGGAVKLPLSWPGVQLIRERWEKTKPGKKLWPFKTSTAYLVIKRVWPEKSPHWLRHNRITKLRRLRDEKKIGTDNIKSWSGIRSDRTIETYGMRTQQKIDEVADAMS